MLAEEGTRDQDALPLPQRARAERTRREVEASDLVEHGSRPIQVLRAEVLPPRLEHRRLAREDDVFDDELGAQAVGDRVRHVADPRPETADVDPAEAPAQHADLAGYDAEVDRTEDRASTDADLGAAQGQDLGPGWRWRHRIAPARAGRQAVDG